MISFSDSNSLTDDLYQMSDDSASPNGKWRKGAVSTYLFNQSGLISNSTIKIISYTYEIVILRIISEARLLKAEIEMTLQRSVLRNHL